MQRTARLASSGRIATFFRTARLNALDQAYKREMFFVAAIGAAIFYVMALSTFSPLDVSMVAAAWPDAAPQNLGGALGANLSGLAVFFFGVVAWLLPVPLVVTAVLVATRRDRAFSAGRILGWTLALAAVAAMATMHQPQLAWRGFDLPSGGVVGKILAELLILWLGVIGSWIVVITATLCATLLILRRELLGPMVRRGSKLRAVLKRKPLWWDKVLHQKRTSTAASDPSSTLAAHPSYENDTIAPYAALERDHSDPHASSADAFAASPTLHEQSERLFDERAASAPSEPAIFTHTERRNSSAYEPPPLSILNKIDQSQTTINPKELEATASLLVRTFEDFGVQGRIIGYQPGPVVTVYEYQPDAGVKQSKILGLLDDLALALRVDSIFIHPVRGKRALGIQVPNSKREPVHLGDILGTPAFQSSPSPLTFGLGKTINGQPMCADLSTMPHLLVAGATGSGKSVGINAMLSSIIMKARPDEVRMILVDPKMLELSIYEGIPHLLMPVITEPAKASLALKWAASEMERRYRLMQLACVRNISGFNDFWAKASSSRKAEIAEAMGDEQLDRLPYILLVIDELADLMMTAPKDVESSIQRLAQKARASGIHMVLATQRPSVDIITGVIKANLPCRIAFQVVSKHDSRTILDLIGAEKLLGKGDMLLQRPGIGRLERLQGALITDEEVLNLVAAVKATGTVQYDESIINWIDDEYARQKDGSGGESMADAMDDDPKFAEAVAIAKAHGVVSASFLQRHLKIGYNRAARIVEFMETKGMVDKADGAKPRRWLGATS